jgi:mannose-6-phosphate isomerase-like protein (cupin superfamily)
MYKSNIEKDTLKNKNYRKVLYTGDFQLVLMSLIPGQEIGNEVHPHTTQFIRVEKGSGMAYVGENSYRLKDGDAIVIPAGKWHNVVAGKKGLKLYTIYSSPEHAKNLVQKVKNL